MCLASSAGELAVVQLTDSTLTSLHSTGNGGALHASGSATVILTNTTIRDCSCANFGGAIHATDATHITLQSGSSISFCSAVQVGQSLLVSKLKYLQITSYLH